MGLQENDIFSDLNDSERFAAGIKRNAPLKEVLVKFVHLILLGRENPPGTIDNSNIEEMDDKLL
jgi:hypothetical protein